MQTHAPNRQAGPWRKAGPQFCRLPATQCAPAALSWGQGLALESARVLLKENKRTAWVGFPTAAKMRCQSSRAGSVMVAPSPS